MGITDYSIDLETCDTVPSAKILSIGVVGFNRNTGEVWDLFYQRLDANLQVTRTESSATMAWWKRQEMHVLAEAFGGKFELTDSLKELRLSIDSRGLVWGNGATFDLSILENAYHAEGMAPPWKFWNVRDMRTLVDVSGMFGFDKDSVEFHGDAHNALDDARHQARVMARCFEFLRSRQVA